MNVGWLANPKKFQPSALPKMKGPDDKNSGELFSKTLMLPDFFGLLERRACRNEVFVKGPLTTGMCPTYPVQGF